MINKIGMVSSNLMIFSFMYMIHNKEPWSVLLFLISYAVMFYCLGYAVKGNQKHEAQNS